MPVFDQHFFIFKQKIKSSGKNPDINILLHDVYALFFRPTYTGKAIYCKTTEAKLYTEYYIFLQALMSLPDNKRGFHVVDEFLFA